MLEINQGWLGAGIPRLWRMRAEKSRVVLECSYDGGFNWESQLACPNEEGCVVKMAFVGPMDPTRPPEKDG